MAQILVDEGRLCAVLDYLELDEKRDFEVCGSPKEHIYRDVMVLRDAVLTAREVKR